MILYGLMLSFSSILAAQTNQELFVQANTAYHHKDYDNALHLYQKINPKAAVIFYNIGNCFYQKGDYMQALINWQHAHKNGTQTICNDCIYNSERALKKLSIESIESQRLIPLPTFFIQILFFLIVGVFLILIHTFLLRKIIILALTSIVVISTGFLTYTAYTQALQTTALTISTDSNLYAGPHSDYHHVAHMPMGSVVYVLNKSSNWVKVRWHKQTGWIMDDKIAVI
jgi:tetratricopeptide (TPR) repeat protein